MWCVSDRTGLFMFEILYLPLQKEEIFYHGFVYNYYIVIKRKPVKLY